ncbi:MAG TPA: hypothetical protein VKA21_13935, partial [Candidatus Binatia bacterium]|nr:hypothetical protein [Candidatus Binatia bacterium]
MASILRALALSMTIATLAHADPRECSGRRPRVTFPSACVGESTTASVSFCFVPEVGCIGSGFVFDLVPPGPPFTVGALRIDGLLGTRPVSLPVFLVPGDRLVAEVTAVLSAPGTVGGRLGWVVGQEEHDQEHDDDGGTCEVDLAASTPVCAAPGVAGPCVGEVCVAGACVPLPVLGPCEDGNACTTGDACVDGVCRPGTPVACPPDGNPCTVDTCDPVAGCVHVASNDACAVDEPCRVGLCDPGQGCVTLPVSGLACDDGDGCTTGDRCDAGTCRGTPVTCPRDGYDCTAESCVAGACRAVPVDARCSAEECAVSACRPGDPAADRRGCVSTPVGEGQACTDDGVACTDDVCTGGACLHVPIDARCAGADECSAAVCSPEGGDGDARGCAAGTSEGGPPDAPGCGEDGDPCTDDRCADGRCLHVAVPDVAACAPLRDSFRKARGLATLSRSLMATIDGASAPEGVRTPGAGVVAALLRLEHAAADL